MLLIDYLKQNSRWGIAALGTAVGVLILSLFLREILVIGETPTLPAFALVHFSGYLFFIISPVELLFVHTIGRSLDATTLVFLAVGTALLAQLIDYAIGYAFSRPVIHNVIGERKYQRYLRRIERYGGITILIFNLFPLSSPIVVLVAGMIRYPLRRMLLFSASGLAAKYLILAWWFL